MELPASMRPDPEAEARRIALEEVLFTPVSRSKEAEEEPPLKAYAMIDASRRSDIWIMLEAYNDPARCMFDGESYDELAEAAPWLVQLDPMGSAWDFFVEEGFGNDWGILIHSRLELPNLKARLKMSLEVTDEDGKEYFFKYYRPRHLNDYLPVLEPEQLAQMFRGVELFLAEDVNAPGELLTHRLTPEGQIETHRITLGAAPS